MVCGNNVCMPTPTGTDQRLATIRALLAKAEATTFAAEAEAFTAKASELMARYSLDEAMVWAASAPDASHPVETLIELHRPFTAQKAVLVNTVAETYGCRALRLGARASDGAEQMSIVGFAADVSLVETLVTSLLLQVATAMTSAPSRPGATASQVASWRRSFIAGFTHTVATRLAADRARATAATPDDSTDGRSAALVLRDRSVAVDTDFRERYPRIRTSRVSSGTSEAGRRAGTHAGERADLGARRVGARRSIGRS